MRFFFFAFFLFAHTVAAQTFNADTAFLTEAKENAISRYNDQLSKQSHLMNGSEVTRIESAFKPLDPLGKTHPYYSLEWIPGNILYGGEWYNSTFRYDLSKDKLITPNLYQSGQVQLVSEQITQFTLGTHRFVHLKVPELPAGFYEIIYDGVTKAYARLQKTEETQFKNNKLVAEFTFKTSYYIMKHNIFYEVTSKKSLEKIFSERKTELKRLLRTQSKPFNKNKEFFIHEMSRTYDQPETTQ